MGMYLHVWLTVKESKVPAFVEKAKVFLDTQFLERAPNGWQLLAAMKVVEVAGHHLPTPPVDGEKSFTFVNVWALPEPINLAAVMFQLSEYGPYVELDNEVSHELQEVIYRVNAPDSVNDDELAAQLKAGQRFAMVRHYPFRQNLAEFAVSSGALLGSFAAQAGYGFGGTYQNITGLLNEFWDLWRVEKGQTSASLREKLIALIQAERGMLGDSYRHSTEFTPKDPDDGVLILEKAEYWV